MRERRDMKLKSGVRSSENSELRAQKSEPSPVQPVSPFPLVPRVSRRALARNIVSRSLLVVLGIFCAVGLGTGSFSIAAEKSDGPADEPVVESPEKQQEPAEGPLRRRLESRMGSTPEERARLAEERKRLSAAAKRFGTDPTATEP